MIFFLVVGFFLAHLVGDYIIQNNWIANRKTSSWPVALLHGALYTVPYVALWAAGGFFFSPWAFLIIGGTHAVIDRYRLVKPLIWGINQLAPRSARYPFSEGMANGGYEEKTPAFMKTWLMIIVDNTVHLIINLLAIWVFLH